MSYENSFKKCSKCNVAYDQNLGSCYSHEVAKQRRIFTKNGKHFCFSCLASEYNVNCRRCHKRINSKDELAYWGGVISVNGSYELDPNPDFFDFRCQGCFHNEKKSRKEEIPSWKDKSKSKCCQGTVFTHHNGGYKAKHGSTQFLPCTNVANEGDFCEHCKGQTETYQQVKVRIAAEEKQGFEKNKQVQVKAQSWWNALSNSERERECERVVENMKLGKYWANDVKEGCGFGWTCDGSWWTIKNGKLTSDSPHLVPIQITEEFMEKGFGNNLSKALVLRNYSMVKKDNNGDKETLPPLIQPASISPQSITNSNEKSDNSVKVNPGSSPQPNPGKDKSSETKNNDDEKNPVKPTKKSPDKGDNETLIINLKSVKKITLSEGNLVIWFDNKPEGNSQTITPDQINNNQELQKVKNYLEKNNQTSLSQRELDNIFCTNNNHSVSAEKPKDNNPLLIGGIVGGTLIIGIGIGLFLKRKQGRKKR